MAEYYLWIKSFHLIAVVSWMCGMLYLPRLYAYHTQVEYGSDTDKIFQTMERRLLRIIINPSMVLTMVLGLMLAYIYGFRALGVWFHIKMSLVIVLTWIHWLLAVWRKDFVNGRNKYSTKFYRLINEVPAIIMILIIILVVVKPFSD